MFAAIIENAYTFSMVINIIYVCSDGVSHLVDVCSYVQV
jgi:hypothetical protein